MNLLNRHQGWLEGEEALASRVLITVLFTDIVGSTGLAAEWGTDNGRSCSRPITRWSENSSLGSAALRSIPQATGS